jgi:uncharacterized protein (DUF58 family)
MPSSLPSRPRNRSAHRDQALLLAVRARLAIHVRRPTQDLFEGGYGSIHQGRSMDFDDLREYVLGDDVADIDWKATARVTRPLMKRYVANRRHAVLLVVDTGRTMAALADATTTKREVAVLAAGIVGELALRHGDSVGLVAGPVAATTAGVARNPSRIVHVPPARGDLRLERLLRIVDEGIDVDGAPSDLGALLDYVASQVRRRHIVVVIADDRDLADRELGLIRRLSVQHELLVGLVGDVALTEPALAGRAMRVVGGTATIAPFFRASAALHDDLAALGEARDRSARTTLGGLGVAATRLTGASAVVGQVTELLVRQRSMGRWRRR